MKQKLPAKRKAPTKSVRTRTSKPDIVEKNPDGTVAARKFEVVKNVDGTSGGRYTIVELFDSANTKDNPLSAPLLQVIDRAHAYRELFNKEINNANRQADGMFPPTSISENIRVIALQVLAQLNYLAETAELENFSAPDCVREDIRIVLKSIEEVKPDEGSLEERLEQAGIEFQEHYVKVKPDMPNEDQEQSGDFPFPCTVDMVEIENLVFIVSELENIYPTLPARRARGRLLIGTTIKDLINAVKNDQKLSQLARNTGLNRTTLYQWCDDHTYAYPSYVEKLIKAFPAMELDFQIAGKVEIKARPDDYINPEEHEKLLAMVSASPRLQEISDNGNDIDALINMDPMHVKEIYLEDTTSELVLQIKEQRDEDVHEISQKKLANETGLLRLFMLSELNHENQTAEDSYEFTTCPKDYMSSLGGLRDEKSYAVRVDVDEFSPLFEKGEIVIATPSVGLTSKCKCLLAYEDTKLKTVVYVLGRYEAEVHNDAYKVDHQITTYSSGDPLILGFLDKKLLNSEDFVKDKAPKKKVMDYLIKKTRLIAIHRITYVREYNWD